MGAEFLRKKLDGPDDSDVDESQGEGAWIFLSHSSKDWPKCQRIRNMLEAKGHKPILFFLKCLEEETELDDLIKREIEARSWFLLCESENARRSKWVQEEVSYIKQFPDKYYETINLNSSVRTQIDRIDRLSKRLTVFVSSASKDRETYGKFKRSLKRRGYNVLDERELIAGNDNFASEMQQIVEQASVKGFVLFLMTMHSSQSAWCRRDIEIAFECGGNVVLILLEPFDAITQHLPHDFFVALQRKKCKWIDFSEGDFEPNMSELVSHMKSCAM